MKKIISYLIAVMMVFTMIPYTAFAESEATAVSEPRTVSYTKVNPAYEDVLSEADLNKDGKPFTTFSSEATYVSTPEEAAEIIREYMISRVDSFMLYYKYPASEVDEEGTWFQNLCDEMFPLAYQHTGDPVGGDYLRFTYGGTSIPETSISSDGTYYYLDLPVTMTYYTTYDQEEELTAAIDALLADIITDDMTDYEKVKAIYDYMTVNIYYDYDHYGDNSYELQFTAYAALVNKTSVCQGYANLFYRLALECGIDSRIISGEATNSQGVTEGHAWNIVKLGEKYYLVDATWDSSRAQANVDYNYFLQPSYSDHANDAEYETDQFKADYPMATEEYVPDDSGDQEIPSEPDGTEITEGDYTAVINNSEATITAYIGNEKDVTIPGSLKGFVVTQLGPKAFMNNKTLESVYIPKAVKIIQDGNTYNLCGTFMGCDSLKTVTFEEGSELLEIGECTFFECHELANIDIPDSVKRLGGAAFQSCEKLTSIDLHEGLEIVEQNTLTNTGLVTLHLPSTLSSFHFINSIITLTEITVADDNPLMRAEDGVLYEYINDGEYRLFYYPEGKPDEIFYVADFATSIYNEAFTYQMGMVQNGKEPELEVIYIKDCKGEGSFGGSLSRIRSTIIPSDSNPYYKSIDGILVSKDGTTLEQVPRSINGTLEIPDGVEIIADYAGEYGKVQKIIMPDSLIEIGSAAFWGCSNLSEIEWSDNLVSIGSSAFNECAIKKISLPDKVELIGNSAFDRCYNLETIDIPASIKEIGWQAFSNTSIKKIEIPTGITYFPFNVFHGCSNLEYIVLPQGFTDIGENVFYGCDALEDIYYGGTSEEWANINILSGNDILSTVRVHYLSDANDGHFHDFGKNTIITKEPTCTNEGEKLVSCEYCDLTYTEIIEPAIHAYNSVDIEPTCTENGYTLFKCAICGDEFTEYEVAALGHTEVVDEAVLPTCTKSGLTAGSHCSVCNEVLIAQEKAEATGHNFIWIIETPATDIAVGSKYEECTSCGEKRSENTEIPKLDCVHDMVKTDAVAATCTKEGNIEYYTCNKCGNIYADEEGQLQLSEEETVVEAIGHNEETLVAVQPTCTEIGLTEGSYCTKCESILRPQEVIDAKGHNAPDMWVYDDNEHWHVCSDCLAVLDPASHEIVETVTIKPDCDTPGEKEYTCKNCDYLEVEELPVLGHDLISHKAKEATCTKAGWEAYETCSRCDYTTYNELAATGHTSGEELVYDDEEHWRVCDYCLECLDTESHEIVETVTIKATCTEPGEKKYSCVACGYVDYEEIPALRHKIVKHKAKAATCTSKGWKAYEDCSRCDYTTYKGIAAKGHKWEKSYTVDKKATKESAGSKSRHCATCDVVKSGSKVTIAKIKTITANTLVYNGNKRTTNVTVTNSKNKKLVKGTDFTVTYKNANGTKVVTPKNVGTYKAVVKFKGQYSGTVTKEFRINPKATQNLKLKSPAKKQIKATWTKRTTQVTGYEIWFSTSKSFTKATTKKYTVKNNKTNFKVVKGLKSGKTYYVKVRTYKKVGKDTFNSAWCKTQKIKTK